MSGLDMWGFWLNFCFFVEIFMATSAIRPRADVAYCIHALARRLAKTHNWTVLFTAFYDDGNCTNWTSVSKIWFWICICLDGDAFCFKMSNWYHWCAFNLNVCGVKLVSYHFVAWLCVRFSSASYINVNRWNYTRYYCISYGMLCGNISGRV